VNAVGLEQRGHQDAAADLRFPQRQVLGRGRILRVAHPGGTVAGLGPVHHVIARGADKRAFALELGASHYIDSTTQDVAAELSKLGGASVILATVTDAKSMSAAVGGLAIDGKLLVVGASAEPIQVSPFALIGGRRSVAGWC